MGKVLYIVNMAAELGRFYGEYLALSSWWIRLTSKISVSVRMYLVADIATDAKIFMSPNTFVIPFPLLSYSWILLICLNPEMRRFVYSGIRWEDCEGTPCSSPLGESIVAASMLISVWF